MASLSGQNPSVSHRRSVPLLVQHIILPFDFIVSISDCFPSSSAGKESACNPGDTGDMGSIPGSGGSPGEGMATHSNILA